jgi:DNA repair protein RadC
MSALHLSPVFPTNEQRVIRRALRLLEKYQRQPGEQFTATSFAKSWVQLQLARQEREVFLVMYLDNQHCLLGHETLFTGSNQPYRSTSP